MESLSAGAIWCPMYMQIIGQYFTHEYLYGLEKYTLRKNVLNIAICLFDR